MSSKIYLIKELAPWMLDELIAFSEITKFDIIFLRKQEDFYIEDFDKLKKNGIGIFEQAISYKNLIRKLLIISSFFLNNFSKYTFNYNGIIGLKSLLWFLKLDLSKFNSQTKIHAQFATQATIVSLLIKKYYNNKPEYSFTFHAYDIYFKNKWFSLLVKNSHKAFSISEFNIKYVKKKYINSDKIILSRLGVNRDLIANDTKTKKHTETFTIGLISWFVEKKGITYLLKAMKTLKEKGNSNIKLQIAGDGPLKNEFLNFVKSNKLENSVEFIGKVKGKAKRDFFQNLDAFVLPSISLKNDQDGIPVVLMEAVAYGLPIISTNVSGIPEICVNDFNGYLIEERNIEQLYNSILKLYNQNTDSFSLNSLKLSEQYDINLNSSNKLNELNWKLS